MRFLRDIALGAYNKSSAQSPPTFCDKLSLCLAAKFFCGYRGKIFTIREKKNMPILPHFYDKRLVLDKIRGIKGENFLWKSERKGVLLI